MVLDGAMVMDFYSHTPILEMLSHLKKSLKYLVKKLLFASLFLGIIEKVWFNSNDSSRLNTCSRKTWRLECKTIVSMDLKELHIPGILFKLRFVNGNDSFELISF